MPSHPGVCGGVACRRHVDVVVLGIRFVGRCADSGTGAGLSIDLTNYLFYPGESVFGAGGGFHL